MEKCRVFFISNGNGIPVDITPSTSFHDVFSVINEQLMLTHSINEYVVLTPKVHEFDDSKIIDFVGDFKDMEFHVVEKSEHEIIQHFLDTTYPSVKFASFSYSAIAISLLSKLNYMHLLANAAANPDDLPIILSMIPYDSFENAHGTELLEAVLKWFSKDFFKRFTIPKCSHCGTDMSEDSPKAPTKSERLNGAYSVSRFLCNKCGAHNRFVRYHSVPTLLEKCVGESTEFVVAFAAIINSLGFPFRIVSLLSKDYFWLEAWCDDQNRYVHIDPYEGCIDLPFNKKFEQARWFVGVGPYECADITYKYVPDYHQVYNERSRTMNNEIFKSLIEFRGQMWGSMSQPDSVAVADRLKCDYEYHQKKIAK